MYSSIFIVAFVASILLLAFVSFILLIMYVYTDHDEYSLMKKMVIGMVISLIIVSILILSVALLYSSINASY